MATIKDHVFAKLVVKSRFATKAQVMECMEARNLLAEPGKSAPTLWDVMIRKGYLTQEQFDGILEGFQEKAKRLFGEIAVKWNMVSGPQLEECLEIQNSMRAKGKKAPRIGQILVSKNYLKKHQVMAILEEQNKKIAKCPACKAQFNLSRVQKGQKFKCTQCGKVLKILQEQESVDELDAHGTMIREPEPEYKKERKTALTEVGGYKILQKLGEDSTGLIYKARDSKGRTAAVKVLSQDAAEDRKFVKEMRAAVERVKALDHPNIKKIFEMGESSDGTIYVVSEFVEGESLRNILNRDGKIGVRKSLKILSYVVEALKYAHGVGLMHGDIRPSNILVSTKGEVILSNLGLETKITDNILNIVDSGHLAPFYIAPETVLDDRQVDFRADIYSLGATLYHVIAGRPPFEGQSPFEVLMRFTEDYLPPIHIYNPETPPGVARVIEKMVSAEPDDRYQTYDTLLEHLQDPTLALGSGSGAGAVPLKEDTRLESLARPGGGLGERPGLLLLLAGLLIVAGGAAFFGLNAGGSASAKRDLEEFKKRFSASTSKLEDLDKIVREAEELKARYPDQKEILTEIDGRISEAKKFRASLIGTECDEIRQGAHGHIAQGDYGAALVVVEGARGRHAAPDWKDAVEGLVREVDTKAQEEFDRLSRSARAIVSDTPPEQLTKDHFDRSRAAFEQLVKSFEKYPKFREPAQAMLDQAGKDETEILTQLEVDRAKASADLQAAVLGDVQKMSREIRFSDATQRIDQAVAQKNPAGLLVLRPEHKKPLEDARARCVRLDAFLVRLTDRVREALGQSQVTISYMGRERPVRGVPRPGRLDLFIDNGLRSVEFREFAVLELVRFAVDLFAGQPEPAARADDLGRFALEMSRLTEDPAVAERIRGVALHHLGQAVSLDPSLTPAEGFAELEREFLEKIDADLEPVRRAAEEKKWSEAVLGALEASQVHFGNWRIWDLRREEVDRIVLAGLHGLHGADGATLVTFDSDADLAGWNPAPERHHGFPDGGFLRLAPDRKSKRVLPRPFERAIFLFRPGEGSGMVKIDFYDAAGKKVPLNVELNRVALNYQSTDVFGDQKKPLATGRWHVLELVREGDTLRARIDFGYVDLTSEMRQPMQGLVSIEVQNSKAGTFDLDYMLFR